MFDKIPFNVKILLEFAKCSNRKTMAFVLSLLKKELITFDDLDSKDPAVNITDFPEAITAQLCMILVASSQEYIFKIIKLFWKAAFLEAEQPRVPVCHRPSRRCPSRRTGHARPRSPLLRLEGVGGAARLLIRWCILRATQR